MTDPLLGECAHTYWAAGDGAPYLKREIYVTVEFEPLFDALPSKEEYELQRRA